MNNTNHVKCSGGIIMNNKNVAVVNQNHDSWSLPKGHIDPGESRLEAAKREIYEETGIVDLQFIRYLGEYSRYRIGLDGSDDKSELKTIYIFLFHSNQIKLEPKDPNNPEAFHKNHCPKKADPPKPWLALQKLQTQVPLLHESGVSF